MKRKPEPECGFEGTGEDIFVVFDGRRIAKQGHPGTPQARTWISLEPGFTVYDSGDEPGCDV
jgi:hypothetical protein